MIVLVVLLVSLAGYRLAGAAGVAALDDWVVATRWALATMLVFTASAHFTRLRHDLVRMVPTWVPRPEAMVSFTGICELAGAVGLLVPRFRLAAGIALVVFFVLIFPANVKAARAGVGLGGGEATPLWLRGPMQLLFIALTWWVAIANPG